MLGPPDTGDRKALAIGDDGDGEIVLVKGRITLALMVLFTCW